MKAAPICLNVDKQASIAYVEQMERRFAGPGFSEEIEGTGMPPTFRKG